MPILHVIDPMLINQGGHFLSQHLALWHLCQRKGYGMKSYTHVDFDESLMSAGVQVEKIFGDSVLLDMPGHYCVELGVSNAKCFEALMHIDHTCFADSDIVFLTSMTASRAVAYGQWLRYCKLRARVGIYATVSSEIEDTQGRDIRRSGVELSDASFSALENVIVSNDLKRSMYRYLFDSIPDACAANYKVFYEEPFPNRGFLELCKNNDVSFVYLHSMYQRIPILADGDDYVSDNLSHYPGGISPEKMNKRINIAYLGSGGVGHNSKGQHLIGDVISGINRCHQGLSYSIQLSAVQEGEGYVSGETQGLKQLEDIQNLKLYLGMLSCNEYCNLIESSSIVLLPYGPRYRHIMSGIFDDCLFLGKICVTPAQSKMALWMERHNLDCPVFKTWDTEGVITALEQAIINYDFYQSQFNAAQKICRQRWERSNPITVFDGS